MPKEFKDALERSQKTLDNLEAIPKLKGVIDLK